MRKQLSQEDISYDNANFWWFLLAYMQGGDNEKELNLNEALGEAIGEPGGPKGSNEWYAQFYPINDQDENGIMESPNEVVGTLTDKLSYAIEFHAAETRYYINDIYIGNSGGEFEAWFFTWDELQAFDRWPYLFLLMLPMAGVEEYQREEAQKIIAEHLHQVSLFAECADYAAKCMLNGLVMQSAKGPNLKKEKTEEQVRFFQKPGIGLVNNEIHSVRNVELYPRYIEDVKAVNSALEELCKPHSCSMNMDDFKENIKSVVTFIANQQYELLDSSVLKHMSIQELRDRIQEYGRTIIPLPEEAFQMAEVYTIEEDKRLDVYIPFYTREEGRSDLTLSVSCRMIHGKKELEINDIEVL